MKKIEKTAKNLDEALASAALEFDVTADKLNYEVIQEVGKGLLGFLVGKEITISAWLKSDEPKPAPSAKPTPSTKSQPKAKTEIKTEVKTDKKPEKEKAAPPLAKRERGGSRPPAPVTDETIENLKVFLSELLNKIGIQHKLEVTSVEEGIINVDVSGERMGLLIGKRGDTLDAVQYLTNLFINKDKDSYVKVNIDTENYRQKREETLVRLAHSLERRVVSTRKSVTLEPMSPYERRIIHAALQGNAKIKTYSVGDEPNRKIVVTLA